jgi:hypothetical protein
MADDNDVAWIIHVHNGFVIYVTLKSGHVVPDPFYNRLTFVGLTLRKTGLPENRYTHTFPTLPGAVLQSI